MVPMQLIVFVVGAEAGSTSRSGEAPEKADDAPGFPAMYGEGLFGKILQTHCSHRSVSM
jgi:hypothetical protein